jgi:hypothetical protein
VEEEEAVVRSVFAHAFSCCPKVEAYDVIASSTTTGGGNCARNSPTLSHACHRWRHTYYLILRFSLEHHGRLAKWHRV